MPDAKRQEIEAIIGRSLLTAETFATELRERLTDLSPAGILQAARAVLDEFEPILSQALVDAELAAWIAGTDSVVRILPSLAREALEVSAALPPTGRVTSLLAGGAEEPIVRFPLLERAAESLLERQIVTRGEFDTLGREARARAFTVAAQDSEDAISTIRDVLAETIDQGASLGEFRKRLGEDLDASFIGPSHRELVYRNGIQTAFHQAHDELADDPIVREIFPYQSMDPITDGRTRPEHLALKTLGIDGTNVYRRDDTEFWNLFLPPWAHACRCGVTLLSVEAAARRGVIEAKIWDRTGVPPANPEHRLQDIPFRPEPGFVGGRRLSLFVRLAQVHAPAGGIAIGGKQFKGGEFIPGDVLDKATRAERAAIAGEGESKPGPALKPLSQRAFTGEPRPLATKLKKSETGALGESIAIQWLKDLGFADARTMNVDRNNFPVDLIQDHEVYEVKAGLISNRKDAQKWRLTIGEPGKKEKAWLKTASPEDKAAWNARKAEMIVERKRAVVDQLAGEVGKRVKLRTLTLIIDPDRKQADIHVFEGSHPIIRWRSELAKKSYRGTVSYGSSA